MFSSSSSSWILHWSTYDSSSHKRDENEDDEHGDKDNEDEDDEPKMPKKNDDISRSFRTNTVLFPVSSNEDGGEGEEGGRGG